MSSPAPVSSKQRPDASTRPRPRSRGPADAGWPRVVPFVLFLALLAVEPLAADRLEPVLDPRWLYGIRSGITALTLLLLWRYYDELRGDRDADARAWALAVLAGVVVFVLWIALSFPPLVTGANASPFDPTVDGRLRWGFALTRLAGAALVVPVMEELFWRSFLMRWLEKPRFHGVDPRSVGWKPLVTTSALFALEHRLWLAGLLAGLLYGELYRRTGSIRVTIGAHALTNALLGAYVLGTGSWGFW